MIRMERLNQISAKWRFFSDNYMVGDDGNLYCVKKLKSGYYRSKEHPYQQVRSTFGTGEKNTQHTVKVHEAVARAFVDNPFNLSDIDHINNDKTDNRARNLQWLSHRDNLRKKSKDKEHSNG